MTKPAEFPENRPESEQAELNLLLLRGFAAIDLPSAQNEVLKSGILKRVAQSLAEHAGLLTVRVKDGVWQNLKPGIRFKPLWTGNEGSSVLVEFAAGAALPVHRHNWLEEGIVLKGDLRMGELALGRLDYHRSPSGSRHGSISSKHGALAFLRGTSLGNKPLVIKELLLGLLPYSREQAVTVFAADDSRWQEIGDGVYSKQLCAVAGRVSHLCRLQPGAKVPKHQHSQDEECMILDGEIFLGDILLKAGDYQLASTGSWHGDVTTDVGATLFVRGAEDC